MNLVCKNSRRKVMKDKIFGESDYICYFLGLPLSILSKLVYYSLHIIYNAEDIPSP